MAAEPCAIVVRRNDLTNVRVVPHCLWWSGRTRRTS